MFVEHIVTRYVRWLFQFAMQCVRWLFHVHFTLIGSDNPSEDEVSTATASSALDADATSSHAHARYSAVRTIPVADQMSFLSCIYLSKFFVHACLLPGLFGMFRSYLGTYLQYLWYRQIRHFVRHSEPWWK
jgi:hypothetical protein